MNKDNKPMDIDRNLAKRLFVEGGVLIVVGVPKGTEFGIDLCSYTIDEKFRGLKMIPPGPHYVWCAAQGPYGDSAPRVGFAHFFKTGEILIREWDAAIEELRERHTTDSKMEKQRICENLMEFDRFLAPYDLRYLGKWKQLTDSITESGIERCRPELGVIRTHAELESCPDAKRPKGTLYSTQEAMNAKLIKDENDLLPQLNPIEGTAPRFTTLPERIPKGVPPAEVSRHSMDSIASCDKLVGYFPDSTALIEEIQVAFVFFLVGFSIESLEHWRKILSLLTHSETAVGKYKMLYMKYSEVLAHQLPHLPEELMEPTERNSVYKDVRSLLVNLNLGGLYLSAERLMKKLEKGLQWHFEGLLDDDPEDLPTVVE